MLERDILIKSFDVYPNSTLKPSALQHYMQQLAREDCDGMGFTYMMMRDVNMVFVITKLGIDVFEPIFAYDVIKAKTFNNRISGVTFEREYEFFKNGKKVIHATTQWVVVRYDNRSIVRPRDFPFEISEAGLDCGSIDLPRVINAEITQPAGERTVRLSDLDENDHLNNCVYSDIAMDVVPYNRKSDYVSSVRIIFRQEARIDDTLSLTFGRNNGFFAVNAHNKTSDKPCFEASFGISEINH